MKLSNSIVKLSEIKNSCKNCCVSTHCLSANLSESELADFDGIVEHNRPMQRGQNLIMAGDPFSSIYILQSGSAKSYVESQDGEQQITGFHFSGALLGAGGIESGTHTYSVDVLETTSVCELKFTAFENMAINVPSLLHGLLRSMSQQINRENEMMLLLGKLKSYRRVALFLMSISKRMYRRSLSAYRINLSMTRHEIANYLGLAVETVSRSLTRMQSQGILEVDRRRIVIKDYDRLQNIADNCETDHYLRSVQAASEGIRYSI